MFKTYGRIDQHINITLIQRIFLPYLQALVINIVGFFILFNFKIITAKIELSSRQLKFTIMFLHKIHIHLIQINDRLNSLIKLGNINKPQQTCTNFILNLSNLIKLQNLLFGLLRHHPRRLKLRQLQLINYLDNIIKFPRFRKYLTQYDLIQQILGKLFVLVCAEEVSLLELAFELVVELFPNFLGSED